MDPLSIATGAASLAATASTLSLWLHTLIKDIKNVDAKLTALSKEVTLLTGILASVEGTIRKCHSQTLALAHLDSQIWQQIENVMVDCKITLEGLDRLVIKIRSESGSTNFMRLFRKPSMHFRLTTKMDDVSEFMTQTYKLNCALQTALAIFNISLSFRTNTSQDLLFRELQSLKGLVEEALNASHTTEPGADPFAARLSRNLHSLAKAAQRFHSTASSTASTRIESGGRSSHTSHWSGSDSFHLTDRRREIIERWNRQQQELEEVQEENTTTTDETPTTDHSTVITTPDLAEASDKPSKQTREVDEDSDGDDSDIELDFLKNFDELAYTSFARKDYSKSEQFLRKAMERSTGESSGETDFNLLRIRLAICCCLQDKWEFASGALVPLSKSKNASNLPVFHLLQAIALGYLANNRLEDAHSVCKTALQGKKKILGKTSDDFQECLSILALIYEKKGDSLEAEAVRLSIPADWTPSTPESLRSGKQYILDHKSLIDLAFGRRSTEPASSSITSAPEGEADVPKSGHWTTLTPRALSDGLQRAKRDERTGAPVGNTDTGKEFLFQNREELIPRRRTEMGILRAINDEYSGKQLGEFDSGKEVAVDTIGHGISDNLPVELPATESKRPSESISAPTYSGIKFEPWWPMPSSCMWENIRAPLTAAKIR
ncbi:hypothetical protein L207DRAFT_255685 [Hyaloscypha variabilis F]|uniref:Azaphilone pigments biosynthesis cluster protein L N-terminal domain-containing protein n=1 Tax=Hyaloscypha variabilis (strain UAMH 11265 / GT02V1 / F) TaxID=1149755 RepID=A0A2J6S3S5_HYAVF|nr:hypothetical protein L207DRAFT_255685 [Hyaloscypha variabilis F]